MIFEQNIISGSNTDLFSSGRLTSIPYNGRLTLDFSSDLATAAANYLISIKLPNGDIPVDNQLVVANPDGTVGVLDERNLTRFTFDAGAGGHFTVTLTETGVAVCTYRAVLSP